MSISIPAPHLEQLCRAVVQVAAAQIVCSVALGERRIIPISGGTIEGPHLRGEILAGGADWQIVRPDGSVCLEARFTVRTDDGALIFVQNRGVHAGTPEILARLEAGDPVDPRSYYFRSTPSFETGAPQYAWLNNLVAIGSAARTKDAVILDFYAVR